MLSAFSVAVKARKINKTMVRLSAKLLKRRPGNKPLLRNRSVGEPSRKGQRKRNVLKIRSVVKSRPRMRKDNVLNLNRPSSNDSCASKWRLSVRRWKGSKERRKWPPNMLLNRDANSSVMVRKTMIVTWACIIETKTRRMMVPGAVLSSRRPRD